MSEEMRGEGWTKAIPEARDRVQSRWLVRVVGAILAALILSQMYRVYILAARFPSVVAWGVGISLGFALLVKMLRAATTGGAVCGGMICWLVTLWTATYTENVLRSGLTPLIILFGLTFAATRMGRAKKTRAGLAESRRGRNAAQVIANLSVAALCGPLFGMALIGWSYRSGSRIIGAWIFATIKVACLAALVEATADTVSSEIGQAFGGEPMMITSLRRVAPGTDGAVTALGTCAGVAGGAVVAMAGAPPVGGAAVWPRGGVVTQRSAKPFTPVQFRPWPPLTCAPSSPHPTRVPIAARRASNHLLCHAI